MVVTRSNGGRGLVLIAVVLLAACSGGSSSGNSSSSPTVPHAPTDVVASPGNASASVSWTAPANDGGSPVTSYLVTSSPGGLTATASAPSTTATVNGLTNGTSYTFTVVATSSVGSSTPSSPSSAVIPAGYTVTYDGNGATGGSVPVDGTSYLQGQTVTVLGNSGALVNAGSSLPAWNTKADGTGTTYVPGDTFASSGNVALYAMWKVMTISDVSPTGVCLGGGALTLTGTNFYPGATVALSNGTSNVSASSVVIGGGGTTIQATVGPLAAGTSTVTVTALMGGSTTAAQTVSPAGPTVFFADPPVVWSGIDTPATVYAVRASSIQSVALVPHGATGPITSLAITIDGAHPNRASAVVPAGVAQGTYDVVLQDQTACPATLDSGLRVVNATSFAVTAVSPTFGWNAVPASVKLAAPGSFLATPRAYLVPHGGSTATPLTTAFQDPSTASAIVPSGLGGGAYDVVVVNPDGSVGLLLNGFDVTTAAPPRITRITPSSIVNASGQQVTVSGASFSGATITLSCLDASGTPVAAPNVTQGTVLSTSASATIDGSGLPVGAVCVLRLTNSDGSYAEHSVVGVTNAYFNLNNLHAGASLTIGRRALAAAVGNADVSDRFVYAIGGDDGATPTPTAFDTVEFSSVDPFGNLGGWSVLPSRLNARRAFAAASVVGRYVYVVGGTDGTSALSSAERALILDPASAPNARADELVLAATGLDPGYWYYRVSAVLDGLDTDNPGGETLPSSEVAVLVPSVAGEKVRVVLTWTPPVDSLGAPLPNVVGYDVYRTPFANAAPGTETLFASLGPNLTYTDAGTGTATPGSQTPLPLGSLGRWAMLPSMSTARKGAAGAVAADPSAASTFYVYSLLGDSGTSALATYEYLEITAALDGRQSVASSWTAGASTSPQARWQLGAWVVDGTVSPYVTAADTFIYLGGGVDGFGNATAARTVEVGKVATGGDLGTLVNTGRSFAGGFAGYGICAANGGLFAFGGLSAAPSSGTIAASLSNAGAGNAPALSPWNPEGLGMSQARYLVGSAAQDGFIYLLGGQTSEPSAASRTTEIVTW